MAMLNINKLTEDDIGREVEYRLGFGALKTGKILGWKKGRVTVQFYGDDTPTSCNPYTLRLI